MMNYKLLPMIGVAVLLGACGGKEAEVCASKDMRDQLVKVFTDGPLSGRGDLLKDVELRDAAILEKDPDSGVLECVATFRVPVGQQVVQGPLEYRIAPAAKSDHDYLLLFTKSERALALADRIQRVFPAAGTSQ
ncbi:hypothetical protein SAMN05216577_12564 [Pseudomonas citronellolis]|jgi:hypothetical protein|uniref:Lipoprotein n=2 Tax=Pseudomonas citronellolis TaxID=53408 RepID=A0AAQ1KI68_9PSED|nr:MULTISPECIES: hypothetical protein [Pseudomonas]MCP1642508.1 hypothetical protein [Pseudomonas citronellolis]MCP1665381.1 hypothetical protein [Pseudomonas citronellolis]UNY87978.1 hypothetical protein MRY70_24300 [Pseudomonas sp. M1]WRT83600.1 hypothetical protein VK748_04020 [Pseudomonas citronellolis]SFD41967.1 hypothetical protein SAMN05216577_12564 [Pseudomonas citronellolis]